MFQLLVEDITEEVEVVAQEEQEKLSSGVGGEAGGAGPGTSKDRSLE